MSEIVKKKGGRPPKHGLIFIPLYASLFSSDKMQLAEDLVDPSGKNMDDRLLVDKMVTRLFSFIFFRGYYVHYNTDIEKEICTEIGNGMNPVRLRIYLTVMLKVGFLNADLYKNHQILSSRGIQQKWLQVMKLSRRSNILIDDRYFIESEKNEYLRDGTVVSSRRNKSKLPKKSDINKKSTDANTVNNNHIELPPENTSDPSGTNPSTIPNQGGVSFLNNSNNEYSNIRVDNKDTNIVLLLEKVPEETIINSGSNANNSQLPPELSIKNPIIPVFVPEETIEPSGINYQMEIALNSQIIYPIETCKWNYLHNNKFERSVSQHITELAVLHWLDDDKKLLEQWLEAFNRSLIDENIYDKSFNGVHGYAKHFKNWVKKRPDYYNTDPTTLFTKSQNNGNQWKEGNRHTAGTGTHQPAERIGGVKTESINRLREAKGISGNNSTGS